MDGSAFDLSWQSDACAVRVRPGVAGLRFARRARRTVLAEVFQQAPLRVLVPETPDEPLPLAVLVNVAGGVVGGDRLETSLVLDTDAAAIVTGQAAEKIYRSAGPDSIIVSRATIGAGAWLEWLPQQTILFDGGRLRRRMVMDVAGDARVLAGEMLVFGRTARGERVVRGLVDERWEIRCNGRLVWTDALTLDGDLGDILDDPMCFDGAGAYATMLYVGADAADRLDLVRELLPDGTVLAAASCLGPLLVTRWLSREPHRLRQEFGRTWAALRHALAALPPVLPRIWHI